METINAIVSTQYKFGPRHMEKTKIDPEGDEEMTRLDQCSELMLGSVKSEMTSSQNGKELNSAAMQVKVQYSQWYDGKHEFRGDKQ